MRRTVCFLAMLACLQIGMLFAQTTTPSARSPVAQDYSFSIPARDLWVDTNIDLSPGDRVHISGAVIDCAGPNPTEKLDVPLPSAPVGALLAKLHAEAAPVVATPDAEFAISEPSHLYLGVNGWRCPGKIPARVHVERRAAQSRNH